MGIMDKLKFWKHDDDFDLDTELPPMEDIDTSFDKTNEPSTVKDWDAQDRSAYTQYPQQNFQSMPQVENREMEIISAKLDAIKSALDSMDQRLRKIEQIADSEQQKGPRTRASKDPWSNY